MTRPRLVSLFVAASMLSACTQTGSHDPAASAPQSTWLHVDPNGTLKYASTEHGDHIMDFSYAGYMGGGVQLPNVATTKTLHPVGDNLDDSANIQSALDELAKLPLKN